MAELVLPLAGFSSKLGRCEQAWWAECGARLSRSFLGLRGLLASGCGP